MTDLEYVEARSLEEACAALARHGEDARIVAGGQVLVTLLRNRLVSPAVLVSVRSLAEGRSIGASGGELSIGAMVTHREVERHPLVARHVPVLRDMELGLASPQVRNAGTLGGNLCHADPAEDPAAVLLALDAAATIASTRGCRRIPLVELFTGYYETSLAPDELLLHVHVPLPGPRSGAAYRKHTTRNAVDFPVAGVAAAVQLDPDGTTITSARIACSALASTAVVCEAAGQLLEGQPADRLPLEALAEAVDAAIDPDADLRGSVAYKRHLARVLARRAVEAAVAQARAG